jgi:peptidoglycan/xylan/chitin deacetylase (PgdA/CDA1 family)
MFKKPFVLLIIAFVFAALGFYLFKTNGKKETKEVIQPTPVPSPTPTPTPKPLTFAEMNALYGPCVYLPTLMYHHVQDMTVAKEKNQHNLTVATETFRSQMTYLKGKGYSTASVNDLVNFFDAGTAIAKKSILITFDDGYDDFYLNALPILKENGFKAIVFLPTGLIGNPDYMIWVQISDAFSGGTFFANHTWSHKNVKQTNDVVEKEITTADTQLADRGLNSPKVFAYPYGFSSTFSESVLSKLGYSLAFTTKPGSTLCKKQRYDLPRIRIGNSSLSSYGL